MDNDIMFLLVLGCVLIMLAITVLYTLDEAGVLDDASDKMTDWLDKNNTADKFE